VIRNLPATALLLTAFLFPAAAQDASKKGPPAFVPLESAAATARLEAAAAAVRAGDVEGAVATYQEVVDGPLADRLASSALRGPSLEQARERAHRECAASPALAKACRKRFEDTAARLLSDAVAASDLRGLREVFTRFPLTDAGVRAGILLARSAWRSGDAEECLGLLDRLLDLHASGLPPGAPGADAVALRAAAAAAAGDGALLEETAAAAARLGADAPVSDGGTLGARIAAARAALAPPGPPGPRGPLVLLWQWMPEEPEEPAEDPEDEDPRGRRGRGPAPAAAGEALPEAPDHLVAVAGGRVYWADRFRVTALDLATGKPVAMSLPASAAPLAGGPGPEHEGETFAPAADGAGVVAALDLASGSAGLRRAGSLGLFDLDLRLRARRGGPADIEHPGMSRRYVFHGRPLLVGDRVYCAATEAFQAGTESAGDVRTHVLAFGRAGLEPAWDTFVAYGSGIRESDVAPAGSLAHRHGRLYFTTQTGLAACLDARTGAVLWAHRYRTPEMAPAARLMSTPDRTLDPVLWYESPPVFSGNLVAFAPRDSYSVEFVFQRPLRETGEIRRAEYERPRFDTEDMTVLWVLPGPSGMFFLAGKTSDQAVRSAAPLVLRDLGGGDEGKGNPIPWRAALEENAVVGLPVRAADALYAATPKALYRVPFPGDGAAERLAVLPAPDPSRPRPSPGNLVVLPDRILSVHDDGVMCFGPAPRPPAPPK
jgi:hypothetical protein